MNLITEDELKALREKKYFQICTADADFGEGWYQYDLYDPEKVDEIIERLTNTIRVHQRALKMAGLDAQNCGCRIVGAVKAEVLIKGWLEQAQRELEGQ